MWFDEFFPKTKIKPFNTFYSRKHFKINLFISLQRLSSPKLYHNRLLLANWLNSITPHSVEKQEIYSHLKNISWKQLTYKVISLNKLISRNLWKMRVNFYNFHTVHLALFSFFPFIVVVLLLLRKSLLDSGQNKIY